MSSDQILEINATLKANKLQKSATKSITKRVGSFPQFGEFEGPEDTLETPRSPRGRTISDEDDVSAGQSGSVVSSLDPLGSPMTRVQYGSSGPNSASRHTTTPTSHLMTPITDAKKVAPLTLSPVPCRDKTSLLLDAAAFLLDDKKKRGRKTPVSSEKSVKQRTTNLLGGPNDASLMNESLLGSYRVHTAMISRNPHSMSVGWDDRQGHPDNGSASVSFENIAAGQALLSLMPPDAPPSSKGVLSPWRSRSSVMRSSSQDSSREASPRLSTNETAVTEDSSRTSAMSSPQRLHRYSEKGFVSPNSFFNSPRIDKLHIQSKEGTVLVVSSPSISTDGGTDREVGSTEFGTANKQFEVSKYYVNPIGITVLKTTFFVIGFYVWYLIVKFFFQLCSFLLFQSMMMTAKSSKSSSVVTSPDRDTSQILLNLRRSPVNFKLHD